MIYSDEQIANIAEQINLCEDHIEVVNIWKNTGAKSVEDALRLQPLIKQRLTSALTSTQYKEFMNSNRPDNFVRQIKLPGEA